ncbi:hypothetical protein MYE70_10675 [Marinobacter alexandrii]|uniref:hypothetical protein n=1 Tax=Marinobacter alexandrii TaxID=2570351 RepID=UPI00200009E6|nr:hypothetical protein [Marinobacter alexandrii]MCK2149530.1 hypothetical protein [Marinobacter alexandrii]
MAKMNVNIKVIDLEPVKSLIQEMISEFDSLPPAVQLKMYALAAEGDIKFTEDANSNRRQTQRN